MVNVPATIGVPPRWPSVSTTPGGRLPAATVQVNGPMPPEEEEEKEEEKKKKKKKKFWK